MDLSALIGTLAAVCTTLAYIPQAVKTIRTKHTQDISLALLALITTGTIFWTIYGILRTDWIIVLTNVLTGTFTCIVLIYKLRFG